MCYGPGAPRRSAGDGASTAGAASAADHGPRTSEEGAATTEVVPVRATPGKAFVVRCPHCSHGTEFPGSAARATNEPPFEFTCLCGRQLRVQVDIRRTLRKRVQLTGAVTFPPARESEVCTVEDLSLKGIGLSVYPPSAATVGEPAVLRMVMNDPRRSRMVLKGVVRRLVKSGPRLIIGIEFDALPPNEAEVLAFYFL